MNFEDFVTRIVRFFSLSIGAKHPTIFGLCIAGGAALKYLLTVSAVAYPHATWLGTAAEQDPIYHIALLLVIVFAARSMFPKAEFSEVARVHLATIEHLIDQGNLSPAERRRVWREVLDRYLKRAEPDLANPIVTQHDVKEIFDPTPPSATG